MRAALERRVADVDLAGIGFGPSNLSLAIALRDDDRRIRFFERQPRFGWHRGMLIDDATMQVSFLKDLVTLRDPTSDFSFICYLHEQGRLLDFINHKTLFPLRIEFHDYLRWAAERVDDVVAYGHEIVDVRPLEAGGVVAAFDVVAIDLDGVRTVTRTRDVVVAAGLVPVVPTGVRHSERIWHTSELLPRSEQLAASEACPRRFVVVGAGQSAAEALAYLHREFPSAEVCAVFARFGYSLADDSPFANRVFDPEAVELFHGASPEVKQLLLDYHRNTNYSVVDGELIEDLYRQHYRERVMGREHLRMLNASRVRACEESANGVELTIESLPTGERWPLSADAVVFATGYRPTDPLALLGAAGALCACGDDGLPEVRRDHSIRLTVASEASIYLQGASEHAFGLTSTLLSTVAVRAGEIADAVRSRAARLSPVAA